MKASQIFNFRGYMGVTLLTGLISVSAMADASHPVNLSQRPLNIEGASLCWVTSSIIRSPDWVWAAEISTPEGDPRCVTFSS